MPTERTISQVTKYWASYLGCPVEALFASSLHIVTHGPALADYRGVFALFRGSAAIVSIPAERVETFRASLTAQPISPATVADAFRAQSSAVIGPAYIGYAEVVPLPLHAARSLTRDDSAAVTALQAACDDLEWEHGGTALDESPASGVFLGGQLVTLAGYDVWGRTIAHISVITHPEFRGRGFGRSAVAHVAGCALSASLIPQYRTLESNLASMRVANSLGFCRYATSIAIRLNRIA